MPGDETRAFHPTPREGRSTPLGSELVVAEHGDPTVHVVVRSRDGDELASVAVSPVGTRTRTLSALTGREPWTRLALYLGVRRARIEGATTITATDLPPAAGSALGLRPVAGVLAQRIDLASHAIARDLAPLDPELVAAEIVETTERWLRELYGRGFFAAVHGGTLTREQYVGAISQMHQFVRWTTRLLGHAVARAHDRALRQHFLDHLQGEINHEVILERDLAHLGEDVAFVVDDHVASPGIRQFMAVQESMIAFHHDPVCFLASPLAAEGVASHLTPAFLAALQQGIGSWGVAEPRKAMVFFTSHVSTDGGDDGHWEQVVRTIVGQVRTDRDLRRFLGVLRASAGALTLAYDEMVDDFPLG